jgi:hypothetical protein
LGHDDAAGLIGPLAGARDHLADDHSELVGRIDTLTRHTDRLREAENGERRSPAD